MNQTNMDRANPYRAENGSLSAKSSFEARHQRLSQTNKAEWE